MPSRSPAKQFQANKRWAKTLVDMPVTRVQTVRGLELVALLETFVCCWTLKFSHNTNGEALAGFEFCLNSVSGAVSMCDVGTSTPPAETPKPHLSISHMLQEVPEGKNSSIVTYIATFYVWDVLVSQILSPEPQTTIWRLGSWVGAPRKVLRASKHLPRPVA